MKIRDRKKVLLSGCLCVFTIAALFAVACGSNPDPGTSGSSAASPDTALSEQQSPEPAESATDTGTSLAVADGEKIFASESMNFSFLYDEAHTAYITDTGAAEIAINGDTSLIGLFVSVADADSLPDVSDIIEEDMFNETQKYQNAIAQPPAENQIIVDDHVLDGYIFSYSTREGTTVDATSYIEKRDGKYIFYKTEVYRDDDDYWAGQDALEKAIRTLDLSGDAYGPGSAVSGEIGTDNTP